MQAHIDIAHDHNEKMPDDFDEQPNALDEKSKGLDAQYADIRNYTLSLTEGLSDADATVQSMEDASPAKWHLAHTSWFFETIILQPNVPDYEAFDASFAYLFNSYYETFGERHPRPARGMLTRPSLDRIYAYRHHVDTAMLRYLENPISNDVRKLLLLGLNHEQQHQELLLTDILHLFSQNPTNPVYRSLIPKNHNSASLVPLEWVEFAGGIQEFGFKGDGFSFDCEGPIHQRLLEPFKLASRCVTNGDWIEFIEADGYKNPLYWLSDGWATVCNKNWQAPLYWEKNDGCWWSMTLHGLTLIDPDAPVSHVSFYEADAYASYADKRLPTEFEWEFASQNTRARLKDNHLTFTPQPAIDGGVSQMFSDVWEWTSSAFSPYPRFRPAFGAVGEYNGKFMSGQYVLRGGSCATSPNHTRSSYRNFFHPDKRWQFTGLRLASEI